VRARPPVLPGPCSTSIHVGPGGAPATSRASARWSGCMEGQSRPLAGGGSGTQCLVRSPACTYLPPMAGTRQRKPRPWRTRAAGEPRRARTVPPEDAAVVTGARYCNPGLGRWVSRDPLEEGGGRNLCAFVSNDAVDYADPHGDRLGPPFRPWPHRPPARPRYPRPPAYDPNVPPSAGQCRIEVCCKPVATLSRAHCVIRITDSTADTVGCRGGPSGTGPSSSGTGRGARPPHCAGCCGAWGTIVAGCGKGAQNSNDPLESGLWDDLDDARTHPARCSLLAENAAACSLRACVAAQMQSVTAGCYKYRPMGPNSNTAWYRALANCGITYGAPGLQPGAGTDLSKAETCRN